MGGSALGWHGSMHRHGSSTDTFLWNYLMISCRADLPHENPSLLWCKLLHSRPEMCGLLYCRTITELRANVNKVWSNHCDWLRKNDFIASHPLALITQPFMLDCTLLCIREMSKYRCRQPQCVCWYAKGLCSARCPMKLGPGGWCLYSVFTFCAERETERQRRRERERIQCFLFVQREREHLFLFTHVHNIARVVFECVW